MNDEMEFKGKNEICIIFNYLKFNNYMLLNIIKYFRIFFKFINNIKFDKFWN